MFTRNAGRLLALAIVLAAGTPAGCQRAPDRGEFGEIITEVPERFTKPYPLPQLEDSEEKVKEAGE